ncbi:hypothetical protein SAMN05216275_104160 [Streptosporangium canum]|uniref:Uncharacterized protein n=1 Tax=Streptosporangium canum TaxID=324952 RepID=A0A1I3JWP4_9ACTN|nr:hypothetical protein [Streptosporangium canum]SFI64672.1 hypothetical protein SAMN05216275_104160 [Streptosporangium canum]
MSAATGGVPHRDEAGRTSDLEAAAAPRRRKTLEERIADRQAERPALKEGRQFEHGPAKFVFVFLIVTVVLIHLVGLAIVMALDLK